MATSEIVIKGTDATSPAVNAARQSLQRLRDEKAALEKQTKLLTGSFGQFGNLAATLGQTQIAGLIAQVENLVVSKTKLTTLLKESKLAMAALGTAAVTTGYSLGDSIRKYIPFFNEPDKLEKAASVLERIAKVSAARLSLRNPEAGAAAMQRADTASQISGLQRFGMFGTKLRQTEEEGELVFQLQKLQAEREIKLEEEKERAIGLLVRNSLIEQTLLQDDFLGRRAVEDAKYQDKLFELTQNQILNEQEKNSLIEQEQYNHQLRLARIHMEAQDKILADDKARVKKQALTIADYGDAVASVLGSLAQGLEAQGKKHFALVQGLRYAEAIIHTAAGITRAFAEHAWPYSMAVAAVVAAAGFAQIATISSTKPRGQAHAGMDYVQREGSYNLQQGEMVLDPGTSQAVRDAAMNGGGQMINVVVNLDGNAIYRGIHRASKNGQLIIDAKAVI